ncbi:MAG: hypothetical protein NVSMB27_26490 [Ktedonobacteraceae bacterium]
MNYLVPMGQALSLLYTESRGFATQWGGQYSGDRACPCHAPTKPLHEFVGVNGLVPVMEHT